jgi:putative membrane protein
MGGDAKVGATDLQFMQKAAHSGLMEVQLAQLAQQKASSEEVKAYAKRLEDDHTKANEELKKIAAERGVNLPSDPGPHQAHITKFQNLSGAEFDRAYARMQVQHHRKDISDFQKQSNRSMDSMVKQFASSQLPILQEHLKQAQALQTSTRSRQSNTK